MAKYSVFLFPLLALVLIAFYPLTYDQSLSKSWKSRRRRRFLLIRYAIVVLPLASVFVIALPIDGLSGLLQGVLFSTVLLLPAYVIHSLLTLKYGTQSRNTTNSPDETNSGMQTDDAVSPDVRPTNPSINLTDVSNRKNDSVVNNQSKASQTENTVSSASGEPLTPLNDASASDASASIDEDRADSPLEVQEQLERMTDLIGTHDLGDSGLPASGNAADSQRRGIRNSHDRHVANTTAMVTASGNSTDLATLSTGEIAQLVTSLRKDKGRLQKLVIAQQAALDTERQAHDQSRTMTRDAIKIMRDSRTAQKNAEKQARRERTERQRVEQEYRKVSHALKNAMSIIDSRSSVHSVSEPKPATETG